MNQANKQQLHARHQSGLTVAIIILISAVALVSNAIRESSAQADAPRWSYLGNNGQTATLLPDGRVLVVGTPEVQLYDPSTGKWSDNGTLKVLREFCTATLLGNGKVLVAGGYEVISDEERPLTNTAELYDPATGESRFTGNSNVLRAGHTATLLYNGKVLFLGGVTDKEFTTTAELYDPSTGQWSLTGNLSTAHHSAAALLQNGKVLVAGGYLPEGFTASAEVYDPNTETWSSTGSLNTPRSLHGLTPSPNGNVLVSGGEGNAFPLKLNTAEIYNPATVLWSTTGSLNTSRLIHSATLLSTGQVLVAGGITSAGAFNSAELYDPATGTWNATASLNVSRWDHSATLLNDGKVLVFGGQDGLDDRSAELSPERLVPAPTPPRIIMASVAGKQLIVVGENFDPGTVTLIKGEEQKTRNDEHRPRL